MCQKNKLAKNSWLEQGCPTQKNYELLLVAHEPPFMIYFAARSAREKKTK